MADVAVALESKKLSHVSAELHELAIQSTGLNDFGDPAEYQPGLDALLQAYEQDGQLTSVGRQTIAMSVASILSARLYTQRGWSQNPAIFETEIPRPLVITGLPRSGTTALHRLLSMDSQFQGLELWLSRRPMTRPPRETWMNYSAYRDCVATLAARNERSPELRKAHAFSADDIEECAMVLAQNFTNRVWTEVSDLPSYASWFFQQSMRGSYRRYADVLRLIGARDCHRRWLLKSPHHLGEVDKLLEVFPEVCVIQTHRDPLRTIPSLCSFLELFRKGMETSSGGLFSLRSAQCINWALALERLQTIREVLPGRFFDVYHQDFLADPLGTVESIYEHFGLVLSEDGLRKMRAWVASRSAVEHGSHRYEENSCQVTGAELREIFFAYRARHYFDERGAGVTRDRF